ncbi:MAG: RIO1 family regulatory kinase/ATPase domain-containing protein, partial [Planctomycetota bacterium]
DSFKTFGLISEELYPVKSGKEGTVYACRATEKAGCDFLAAKIYKHVRDRSFRNDAVYQEGRLYGNSRERRAYETGTEFGLDVHFVLWVSQEWETLTKLYNAGVYVPVPIKSVSNAILMEFYGDETGAMPQLIHSDLTRQQSADAWQLLKANIEMMLQVDMVHGDLSPYNVLVDADDPKDLIRIIDVPQAVDARMNRNAREMLQHDVDVCYQWFNRKHGIKDDPKKFVASLWKKWKHAEL